MSSMPIRRLIVAAAVLLMSRETPASAGMVLDQSNPTRGLPSGFALVAGQAVAQSITVGMAGTLAEVNLGLFRCPGATGTVSVSIAKLIGGRPDPNPADVLFSTTINASQIQQRLSTDTSPVTSLVAFNTLAAGIAVTQGEQLAIMVSGTGSSSMPWIVLADGRAGYAGGSEYRVTSATSGWLPSPLASNSLFFSTMVQTLNSPSNLLPSNAVPEPGSMTLVAVASAIGLGVGWARRQRSH